MTLEAAYNYLYEGALIAFAILIGAMLIRSIKGPAVTDRVLAINMIGTMVISAVAILSQYLKESYLLDVGLIYTMISFISVLVLASVYIPFRAGSKADDRIGAPERDDAGLGDKSGPSGNESSGNMTELRRGNDRTAGVEWQSCGRNDRAAERK